jgi:catalase
MSSSNANQTNPLRHPLDATAMAIQGASQGEGRAPRVSHMQSANEGPADIIGKVSGAVQGGKRMDDGAYFTNNEAIPWPDPYVC